ncbi:MAG TPA: hypothetical protein VN665_00340 [Candidatus Paceibacterota bacterium]|nr:hypothetical protein [Candidatus Paceibacterota bacterium]
MLLKIPSASDVVPGTEYSGFKSIESSDPRADAMSEINTSDLTLAWPGALIPNANRSMLNKQGIILGIGLAFALKEHPSGIPEAFKGMQDGEPVKIITSTRMSSEYDDRIYLAYFYINEKGELVTSYVAHKPWATECPSPAVFAV